MTQHLTCRAPYTAKECADCKFNAANQRDKPAGQPITPSVRPDKRCRSFNGVIR